MKKSLVKYVVMVVISAFAIVGLYVPKMSYAYDSFPGDLTAGQCWSHEEGTGDSGWTKETTGCSTYNADTHTLTATGKWLTNADAQSFLADNSPELTIAGDFDDIVETLKLVVSYVTNDGSGKGYGHEAITNYMASVENLTLKFTDDAITLDSMNVTFISQFISGFSMDELEQLKLDAKKVIIDSNIASITDDLSDLYSKITVDAYQVVGTLPEGVTRELPADTGDCLKTLANGAWADGNSINSSEIVTSKCSTYDDTTHTVYAYGNGIGSNYASSLIQDNYPELKITGTHENVQNFLLAAARYVSKSGDNSLNSAFTSKTFLGLAFTDTDDEVTLTDDDLSFLLYLKSNLGLTISVNKVQISGDTLDLEDLTESVISSFISSMTGGVLLKANHIVGNVPNGVKYVDQNNNEINLDASNISPNYEDETLDFDENSEYVFESFCASYDASDAIIWNASLTNNLDDDSEATIDIQKCVNVPFNEDLNNYSESIKVTPHSIPTVRPDFSDTAAESVPNYDDEKVEVTLTSNLQYRQSDTDDCGALPTDWTTATDSQTVTNEVGKYVCVRDKTDNSSQKYASKYKAIEIVRGTASRPTPPAPATPQNPNVTFPGVGANGWTLEVGNYFTKAYQAEAGAGAATWSSSNPAVASVDQNGKVTALKAGTTTITVTLAANEQFTAGSASYLLTVTNPAPPATCSNGATDYPTCTPSKPVVTPPAKPTNPTCSNGATDYPTCTPSKPVVTPPAKPANPKCSNGATDYPTCTPSKPVVTPPVKPCRNGAQNPPACDDNLISNAPKPDQTTGKATSKPGGKDAVFGKNPKGKTSIKKLPKVQIFTDNNLKVLNGNKPRMNSINWMGKMMFSVCVNKKGVQVWKCKYNPRNDVNRGAMSEFIWKVMGAPNKGKTGPNISKLPKLFFESDKYVKKLKKGNASQVGRYNTIQYLEYFGIYGKLKAKFNPQKAISRSDMAAWLYNAAGHPKFTPKKSTKKAFEDVKSSTKNAKQIWWLYEKGVTIGDVRKSGRYYMPTNSVNRGAMAEYLYKFYTKVLKK